MRVDDFRTERAGGDAIRSVRLSWVGGATRLWVRGPEHALAPDDDLSPFVPVALMLAMRRSEPLAVHGPVSPWLLEQLPLAQQLLSAWDATLTRVPVRASSALEPGRASDGRGLGFSRGVDSTYSAIAPRRRGDEITRLLYCMEWDPTSSPDTERLGRDAALCAAEAIGLEALVVATNVREVLWGVLDWADAHGPALAMLGLSLPRAFGRFVIASNAPYWTFLPRGSHPELDRLWSTERVEISHDDAQLDRTGKVAHIAGERPDLLDHLYVCFGQDSVQNCGTCPKCLLTMAGLQAAGANGMTGAFPAELDLDALRSLEVPALVPRVAFNNAYGSLPPGPEHEPLRAALAEVLRNSKGTGPTAGDAGMYAHSDRLIHAMFAGEPYAVRAAGPEVPPVDVGEPDAAWPPPRDVPRGQIGLIATVDERLRRHAYGAGAVPPGRYIGELGALLAERPPEGVPLRLDASGRPQLEDAGGAGLRPAVRWALAPLGWSDLAGPVPRARSAVRRSADAARARRRSESSEAVVAGWLHGRDAPGRLPLFAARHSALDDVLLTTNPAESAALGYLEPRLLGYLEASAPETGRLGVVRPPLPWTDRWGQAARRAASAASRA